MIMTVRSPYLRSALAIAAPYAALAEPPAPQARSMVRVGQAGEWYQDPAVRTAFAVASFAGLGLGAYHGYRRTGNVGWAIGWGLLGGLFPFITIPVALAQGFGKRA